jgi:2-ketoarginine methyltransferase
MNKDHLYRLLDYVSKWATAELVAGLVQHHELYDALREGVTVGEASKLTRLSHRQVASLLETIRVEDIVDLQDDRYVLTDFGRSVGDLRGHMNLIMRGYQGFFHHAEDLWRGKVDPEWRSMREVGIASAQISEYDTIPLVTTLLHELYPAGSVVVDFGCGNALYLVKLCEQEPQLRGIGIEADKALCAEAHRMISEKGLQTRVQIVNAMAQDYVPEVEPDFIVFGFVLQELLEWIGVNSLERLLDTLGKRFPRTWFIVIEVDAAGRERTDDMRNDPHMRGYYNPYYMLHDFTQQRLLTFDRWRELFRRVGFEIHRELPVDPAADATGLERAFALRYRGAA